MNLKDIMFIIKRNLFNKKNTLLILVLFFIFIILFFTLNFYFFINYNKNSTINNINSRTITLLENNIDLKKIENIDHVLYVIPEYLNSTNVYVNDFNYKNLKGYIKLTSLVDNKEIVITRGQNKINKNEAICSANFYPYYLDDKINYNSFIKNPIGKTFKINNTTFTIVGTYNNTKNYTSLNNCYILKEDLQKIKEKSLDHYLIRVDSKNNIEDVSQKLLNLGFKFSMPNLNTTSKDIETIIIFIIIIIFIFSFNIIYNFIKKKILYNNKHYGILKTCGYPNKEIFKIDFLENILLCTTSFIISLITYVILFYIITHYFFNIWDTELYNGEITYQIPYYLLFLTYFISIIIIFVTDKILLKKSKNNIIKLLRS